MAKEQHPIGPTDTVPAMLSPGEFVLPKEAVDLVGKPTLEEIRKAGLAQRKKGYADGGEVDPGAALNEANARVSADQREQAANQFAAKTNYKPGTILDGSYKDSTPTQTPAAPVQTDQPKGILHGINANTNGAKQAFFKNTPKLGARPQTEGYADGGMVSDSTLNLGMEGLDNPLGQNSLLDNSAEENLKNSVASQTQARNSQVNRTNSAIGSSTKEALNDSNMAKAAAADQNNSATTPIADASKVGGAAGSAAAIAAPVPAASVQQNGNSFAGADSTIKGIPKITDVTGVQSATGTITQPVSTGIMRGQKAADVLKTNTLPLAGARSHFGPTDNAAAKANAAPAVGGGVAPTLGPNVPNQRTQGFADGGEVLVNPMPGAVRGYACGGIVKPFCSGGMVKGYATGGGVSSFTPSDEELKNQNANTQIGETKGFTQNTPPAPKEQPTAKVSSFTPSQEELNAQTKNTNIGDTKGFTQNVKPEVTPKVTGGVTTKVSDFIPSPEDVAAQRYDTVGATGKGGSGIANLEKARKNILNYKPPINGAELSPGVQKRSPLTLAPEPANDFKMKAFEPESEPEPEPEPAKNSGEFQKAQEGAQKEVIDQGKARVADLKAQNANMPKGIPGAVATEPTEPTGWDAGSKQLGEALNAGKGIIKKVAGATGRGIGGVGNVLGIAQTASAKSPVEQYAESKGVSGVDPQEVWKKPVREGLEKAENWVGEKAAGLFGGKNANAAPAPTQAVKPVEKPAAEPAKAAETPMETKPAATEHKGDFPEIDFSNPSVKSLSDAKSGAALNTLGNGQTQVDLGKNDSYIKTANPEAAERVYKGIVQRGGVSAHPPKQSAAAEKAGTTDFWLNRGYAGGAQQYQNEQRQKFLEDVAMNGGPNAHMDVVQAGAAKRRQAIAADTLKQMREGQLKQQELTASEKHTDAANKLATAQHESNIQHQRTLEQQGKEGLDLKRDQLKALTEAKENAPKAWTTTGGNKIYGTRDDLNSANQEEEHQKFVGDKTKEYDTLLTSKKDAADRAEQEWKAQQAANNPNKLAAHVAEVLQNPNAPAEVKQRVQQQFQEKFGKGHDEFI